MASLDVLHNNAISGENAVKLLPPRLITVEEGLVSGGGEGGLGGGEVVDEFGVGVVEKEVVVDERLPGDDAEEVNKPLGGMANVGGDGVAPSGRVEDG